MQAISQYDTAFKALIEAKTLKEVKNISDKAVAIQEYARRAGDKTLEINAAELRWRAERKLGEILKDTPKAKGRLLRGTKKEPRDDTPTLSDLKIGKKLSSHAQKLASQSVEKFEETINKMLSRIGGTQGDWYQMSESPEWETPQWLFDILNKEFHFTLDVCASSKNHKCSKYLTKKDNGLKQKWKGICWMNPPYGRKISEWMSKAKQESQDGALICCLIPARTDTDWWWENCLKGEIRFIRGRLKWPGSDTMAPFPSAIIILSNKIESKVVWWNVQSK